MINDGIYPTMITPFTKSNRVDIGAVKALVDYYSHTKCQGIFALCLSSEIFHLSDKEMLQLLDAVASQNASRMTLVASGHTSPDVETQITQLSAVMDHGADQPVIILNRLALPCESEEVLKQNFDRIFNALPQVQFGIYECPYPYKRLVSLELMDWLCESGRVGFFKDTSCDIRVIRKRLKCINQRPVSLFNANTTTLLPSLQAGASGFSGVMANFHAHLYTTLFSFHQRHDPRADKLQSFLSVAALAEHNLYPVNAKYHLRHLGIDAEIYSRSKDISLWNHTRELETDALALIETEVRTLFENNSD